MIGSTYKSAAEKGVLKTGLVYLGGIIANSGE
jgi:hypothetical protein